MERYLTVPQIKMETKEDRNTYDCTVIVYDFFAEIQKSITENGKRRCVCLWSESRWMGLCDKQSSRKGSITEDRKPAKCIFVRMEKQGFY